MKAALYVRVSTKNHGQDVTNQLLQLRDYAQKAGITIYKEYADNESGDSDKRKGFTDMLADAAKRKFDVLLFWSLDRFSREGVRKTIYYFELLESYGINFKSYTEQYLDSTGIFKDVIISLLATLARQEKVRISERVKAGLQKAALRGRKGGRPSLDDRVISSIKELKTEGLSNRKIAARLSISNTTVGFYV